MEAATKRVGDTSDRLSALTDDLLHRVLSFLPSQLVVETSMLSKRWTNLWRSVPCIDIDILSFPSTTPNHRYCSWLREKWEKMEDFTTNLLMYHNAPTLDAFRLEIDFIDRDRLPVVNRWIRRCIRYRPSVLQIVIVSPHHEPYELPHMGSGSCRLKRLLLDGVTLDSYFAEQLQGCPVLEDLELSGCDLGQFREIQSNTLKNLAINGCLHHFHSGDMLVIRAPALTSLRLNTPFYIYSKGAKLEGSMCSLVKASVTADTSLPPLKDITRISPVELLGSLYGVTNLELTRFCAKVMLDDGLDKFPIFNNLRTLSLQSCLHGENDMGNKLQALGRFLDKAPNLEKLTLQHCWNDLSESKSKKRKIKASELYLHGPDQKAFQCQNLKLIEIKYEVRFDHDTDRQLFQFMWGLWRNLQKATFTITKI